MMLHTNTPSIAFHAAPFARARRGGVFAALATGSFCAFAPAAG